jgi:hypothetical protein
MYLLYLEKIGETKIENLSKCNIGILQGDYEF